MQLWSLVMPSLHTAHCTWMTGWFYHVVNLRNVASLLYACDCIILHQHAFPVWTTCILPPLPWWTLRVQCSTYLQHILALRWRPPFSLNITHSSAISYHVCTNVSMLECHDIKDAVECDFTNICSRTINLTNMVTKMEAICSMQAPTVLFTMFA